MVRKSTACNECRSHRRKCIRATLNEECDRCKKFDLECSFPGETLSSSDDTEFNKLIKETDNLNLIIKQLEEEMRTLTAGRQRQIKFSPTTTQQSPSLAPDKPWKLTMHNGMLRIETGIWNISDLMSSQPIRYLSPRISADQSNQDLVVHFNIGRTVRLRMVAMKLFVTCVNPIPNPTTLLLPTSFLFNVNEIIDKMVNTYFKCFNICRPLLHEPSFKKYYERLDSPIDSLLCLCICCIVCASPCPHLNHTLEELRCMSDYFAGVAKSKILDQFDLPEKRLENVIAVHMLSEYFYTVLNVSEGLKLISMGYQICMDLKPWYDEECKKPGPPSIEVLLFSRHFPRIMSYNRLSEVIGNRTQHLHKMQAIDWKYLPDEPQQTINSIEAINLHYKLINHPIIAKIRFYRHYFSKDSIHAIKFSDIILVDGIIAEWWHNLPLKYRICEDWLNVQQLKIGIDQNTDSMVLLLVVYFLSYNNDIYATLLTPNDADFILSMVHEQALARCLYCSQVTVYALHRLTRIESISPCHYTLAAHECLSHTLDVLSILSASSNTTVRDEARSMLKLCMSWIDDMEIMRDHKIDPLKSPLLTGTKERGWSNINPSVYYNYPHPYYAAMSDICHYLEKVHLTDDDAFRSPSPPSFGLN
ncbi:hypothetical protein K501DRAFT_330779 [Backusella circina FSU 941]|nr:hypothetical protein K501DRAFT_330779 [Backusella circina FSU 941]